MSIASEITRLQGVKSDILTAISNKGVTVPAGAGLDDVAGLITDIPSGGGEIPTGYKRVLYVDTTSFIATNDNRVYLPTDKITVYCQYDSQTTNPSGDLSFIYSLSYRAATLRFVNSVWLFSAKNGSTSTTQSSTSPLPSPEINKCVSVGGEVIFNDDPNYKLQFTPGSTTTTISSFMQGSGNNFTNRRFYYATIERDNKLIAHFVPALDPSNNIVLIDLLDNSIIGYFKNGGTAGPVVE